MMNLAWRACLTLMMVLMAAGWQGAGAQETVEPAQAPGEEAAPPAPLAAPARTLGIILYPGFEVLDVMGPVEMFMNVGPQNLKIVMIAEQAGEVASGTVLDRGNFSGPRVMADYGFADAPKLDLLLVPGGVGTFAMLNNPAYLEFLKQRSPQAELTMSVCSGSAILAKAGLLDGRRATCNKAYYAMLTKPNGPNVDWAPSARWVEDGNMITSSGVSAGIDMALAVIARVWGREAAERIATGTEYVWNSDPANDPFAKVFPVAAQGQPMAPVPDTAP